MRHILSIFSIILFILVGITFPFFVFADSTNFQVSGWIPYWESSKGTRDARANIDNLSEINPFGFVVKENGTLKDLAGIKKSIWQRLIKDARSKNVKVLPTVMWSNGVQINTILSDNQARTKHVKAISDMVRRGEYDGVDIDYEGKKAETKVFYSLFIKELKEALGPSKILSCTIEARTPPDSLYKTIPTNLQYANDYITIGQYCDEVKIMAYDQQRADLKLNDSKKGSPYFPNSDVDWVKKVLELTIKTIPKEKIMLGIPTYGREVEVTVSPDWFKSYKNLHSVNQPDALKTAKKFKVTPSINKAGEMSFSYLPKNSPTHIPSSIKAPDNTLSGEIVSARALAYANSTGQTVSFNYVSWSDSNAVKQKVELAKQFGIRGVAIFKIDGQEDKKIWNLF